MGIRIDPLNLSKTHYSSSRDAADCLSSKNELISETKGLKKRYGTKYKQKGNKNVKGGGIHSFQPDATVAIIKITEANVNRNTTSCNLFVRTNLKSTDVFTSLTCLVLIRTAFSQDSRKIYSLIPFRP